MCDNEAKYLMHVPIICLSRLWSLFHAICMAKLAIVPYTTKRYPLCILPSSCVDLST